MNATILSMDAYRAKRMDPVRAERDVLVDKLQGLPSDRINFALAQYANNIRRGVEPSESRRRVAACALNAMQQVPA